jgi:hypothetical protein
MAGTLPASHCPRRSPRPATAAATVAAAPVPSPVRLLGAPIGLFVVIGRPLVEEHRCRIIPPALTRVVEGDAVRHGALQHRVQVRRRQLQLPQHLLAAGEARLRRNE